MPMVTVRYWAAAKQAAGVAEETLSAATLAAAARRPGSADFQAVLARSSILVNGEQAARRSAETMPLDEGTVIEVLPPFAGG